MDNKQIIHNKLSSLFFNKFGIFPEHITELTKGGGDRKYYRLTSENFSVVGVFGSNLIENSRFIYLSKKLGDSNINVPEVFEISEDGYFYIQEDLGNTSLFEILDNKNCLELVAKCMQSLPEFQLSNDVDFCKLYNPFGRRMILRDLNYMKFCMLKTCGIDPDEDLIDDDFELMADRLAVEDKRYWGLMYRDFQSRNIMIKSQPDGKQTPWFIDYQGARFGPVLYDVASFLWQARAAFSKETRLKMSELYISTYCKLKKDANQNEMHKLLPEYVLVRVLQTLGAYGFRGLTEHKAHFLQSIPPAIKNVEELICDGVVDIYPEIKKCLQQLVQIWNDRLPNDRNTNYSQKENKLNIQVFSFSYKKGYPEDYTGNGGGFVFDCRGMHNPGRYNEYKNLTGRDKSVIDFLESKGEVQKFLATTAKIIEPSIETYIRRGFSNLQIGFGCTGGQHRSVYCAEAMANLLIEKYGNKISVELCHREQNSHTILQSG